VHPGDQVRLFGNPNYDDVITTILRCTETEEVGTVLIDHNGHNYPEEYGWEAEILRFGDPIPRAKFITWTDVRGAVNVACRDGREGTWTWNARTLTDDELRHAVGVVRAVGLSESEHL
jgi:hypothetical protein